MGRPQFGLGSVVLYLSHRGPERKDLSRVPLQVGETRTLILTSRPVLFFCPTLAASIAEFKYMPPKLSGMLSSASGRGPTNSGPVSRSSWAQRGWPWFHLFTTPSQGWVGPCRA